MQQLVGLSCAVCGDRIDSTLEAEFCPACFGPVHLRCKRAGPSSETACAACGGNLAHPVGLAVRQEKEKAAAKAAAAARALAERPTGLQLAVRNGFRLLACVGLGYLLFQRPSMGTVEW